MNRTPFLWRGRWPWLSLALLGAGLALATSGRALWNRSRVESIRRDARAAAQQQDWIALEQHAREWAARAPQAGEARVQLAAALEHQGRLEEAATVLEQVATTDPHAVAALERRVELEFGPLGRPVQGVAACRALIQVHPQNKLAHQRLALFYALTIQRPELLETIRGAVARGGDSPALYALLMRVDQLAFRDGTDIDVKWGGTDPAPRQLREAALVHAVHVAINDELLQPGPATSAARRAAVDAIYAELKTAPDSPALLDFALTQAAESGEVDEMGRWLSHVPEQLGGDPVFWRHRGVYHAAKGDPDRAEQSFQRALELHPLSARARQELATLLRGQGRVKEAERQQRLAAAGQELVGVIERQSGIERVFDVTLRGVAEYAADCGDWETAAALHRHILPTAPSGNP